MAFLLGIIISFCVYVSIGIFLFRKVKSSEEYYVSGRSGNTLMITGTLVASFLSTVSFMGEAGFSYEGYPILLLILVIFNASGYIFGVFLFGRYLRRSKSLTVPEFFGNRFHSKKVRLAAAITTILGIAAYLVAVTQGAAVLLAEVSGVSYPMALVIMWVVYSSFTILSGAKGVMVNDTVMFFLFSIATYISFPYIIKSAGGFPDAVTKAANLAERPDLLSWHGITGPAATMGTPWEALAWAVIMGLVWGIVIAVSPWQSSRYLMAKNEHVAIRAGVWATISILTVYLFLHISISTITTIKADIAPTEKVFIWAAMNIVPTWLGVIIVSGIMAAALSSCSSFLQIIGSSITRDIMEQSRKKEYTDHHLLRASRISIDQFDHSIDWIVPAACRHVDRLLCGYTICGIMGTDCHIKRIFKEGNERRSLLEHRIRLRWRHSRRMPRHVWYQPSRLPQSCHHWFNLKHRRTYHWLQVWNDHYRRKGVSCKYPSNPD